MIKKIILAGGSGFLGTSLGEFLLSKGYEVVILSRSKSGIKNGMKYVQWDGVTLGDWVGEIDGSDAVVNFTGKSVNCIYTKKNREEIVSSRLDSVRVLREAFNRSKNPPRLIVQAGSLAIFRDTRDVCDENSKHGSGFSVDVCEKWEEEFFKDPFSGARKVLLRIGFALRRSSFVLKKFKRMIIYFNFNF